MSKIRALFLGTPEFSAKILEGLLLDDSFEIIGVVTQPDKPKGRDMTLSFCPTKGFALRKNLVVFSPFKINAPDVLTSLAELRAEVAIVVAFGQILSDDFLKLFTYGAVNIHGSELPRWRGAAPIQRSIEAGEAKTAVTLQKITKELDAGDIIGTRPLIVTDSESALDVLNNMIPLSLDLLRMDLMDFIRGNLAVKPQDHKLATFAPKILKSETQIDWTLTNNQIHNKVRAFQMGPGAWGQTLAGRLKLIKTKVTALTATGSPGEIKLINNSVIVVTGSGALEILEVHPESKKRQPARDWWNSIKSQNFNHIKFEPVETLT